MNRTRTFIVRITRGDAVTEFAVIARTSCDALDIALAELNPDDPQARIEVTQA